MDNELVPMSLSQKTENNLKADLLLVYDGQEYRSVLLTDLFRLVALEATTIIGRVLCLNCFHFCMNQDTYSRHRVSFLSHEPALIKMSKPQS